MKKNFSFVPPLLWRRMGVGGSSIVGRHSRSFGVLPSLSSKVFTLFPDYQVWGNGTDNGIKSLGLFTTSDSWYDGIEMISAHLGLYSVSMSALNEEDEMTLLLIINVGFHCQYSPFLCFGIVGLWYILGLHSGLSGIICLSTIHSAFTLGTAQNENFSKP